MVLRFSFLTFFVLILEVQTSTNSYAMNTLGPLENAVNSSGKIKLPPPKITIEVNNKSMAIEGNINTFENSNGNSSKNSSENRSHNSTENSSENKMSTLDEAIDAAINDVPIPIQNHIKTPFQSTIQNTKSFESAKDFLNLSSDQSNQKIILNNIEFKTGSAEFDSASKQVLGKVLTHLKNNPFKALQIWGHTDFRGPASKNEALALNRAKAVYDLFKKAKVPASLMSYDAFGERRPVSLGLSETALKKNRRVEIIVIRE